MATSINLVIHYELTTSDPDDTEVTARASGDNVYLGSPQVWADGRTITIPYKILYRPGEFASIRVTVECSSPAGSDFDSKDLGSSYIVAIPRYYSVSVEPSTINKVDTLEVRVTGLDDIDDSYGSLEVEAHINGHSYRLDHRETGTFSRYIDVNFRNQAGGSKEVEVQVYKYYAGVSAHDRKSEYVRVIGRKPSISGEVPSTLHRGDSFAITVSEPDGDALSATLHAFGREYSLSRGTNEITVPQDIDQGSYTLRVEATDADGTASRSWNVNVVNAPPRVSLALDRDHVTSGDSVQARVTAWDDSPGLELRLAVEEIGYSNYVEPNTTVSIPVPGDYHGNLTFIATATDRDGASTSDTATARAGFPPSVSGEVPSSLHRGDDFIINIDGDEVEGTIEAFGNSLEVEGAGDYRITVPRNIDAGSYTVSADLSSPYGSADESWDVQVLNQEPRISIALDRNKVPSGGYVTVSIDASDDSDGLRISLEVPEIGYSRNVTSSTLRVPIPSDYHGNLTFIATATDRDGAEARDEDDAQAGYPPVIEGGPSHSLHRGDSFSVTVSGDEVSGSIEAFGSTVDVTGSGDYQIAVPTDLRAGTYTLVADVSSPYGSASKQWGIEILNERPVIEVEAPSEARVGDTITIGVSWSDDADGPEVSLTIDGEEYPIPPSGLVRYTIPEDKAGKELDIVAKIVDIDGMTSTDSATINVEPVSPSTEQGSSTGSSSGSTNTSTSTAGIQENVNSNSTDSATSRSSPPLHGKETEPVSQNGSSTSTGDEGMHNWGGGEEGRERKAEVGFMDVVVVPEDPYEGDEVNITVKAENTRGSLWIVAPNGTALGERYVKDNSSMTFKVDRAGLWLVKWVYKSSGRTVFGRTSLYVRKHPENSFTSQEIPINRTRGVPKRLSVESMREKPASISPYRMTCMAVRKARGEDSNVLQLLAMITVLAFLIAWVRVR